MAQLTKFFSYDGKNQLTKNTPAIANPVKNHLFGCDKNVKETFIKVTSTSVLVICCNMFSPYKQITTKYLAQLSKHFSYDGKNAIFNHLGKMATLLCLVNRSSCSEVFCKKRVLRSFAKFTGKHLCHGIFFNKVASACNFIKKETLAQVFSCEFCEIFKSTFSYRTPSVAASM